MGAAPALGDYRVALVVADGLDEVDLLGPVRSLQRAGWRVEVIGVRSRELCLLRRDKEGRTEKVPYYAVGCLGEIAPAAYEAMALASVPLQDGSFEMGADVLDFVRGMQAAGKPVLCFPPHAVEGGKGQPPKRTRLQFKRMLADSWCNWNAINAPRLGAALAYYSLLSLAPLLIITVVIAGAVFQRADVQSRLVPQVRELMGDQIAETARAVLARANPITGTIAGVVSLLMLLLGASGLFQELRDTLNTVWGVKANYGSGVMSLIRARAYAFLLILGVGVLAIVFLAVNALFATRAVFLLQLLPGHILTAQLLTWVASIAGMTLIFALLYKVVPDTYVRWGDVWIGALVTSALFSVGKTLIGFYLQHASVGSAYAAAGSLVVLLTWVYYSAQIFLLGAEFTHVYAYRHGSYARPAKRDPARPR